MKLFVRLFYILLAILLAGVVLLFVLEPTSVVSRIATGLVTGSFVGLVSALTNYCHLRQTFFENLVVYVSDVSMELEHDYLHAKARNEFIKEMPKQRMIEYAADHEQVTDNIQKVDEMKAKYEGLVNKFDFGAFVPLIPFANKNTRNALDGFERLMMFNVRHLYSEYQMCFDFTLLSANVSEEEREICIGDPDEFYEFAVQNNINFRDLLAYYLDNMAELGTHLSRSAKRYMSKKHLELLEENAEFIREAYLKDAVIRDVIHERVEQMEDPNEDIKS